MLEEIYKVSIIVPVYNVEKYLKKCIDSLINQTYKNIEIILVDDGATDNSGDICNEYARKDTRCKVYHIENSGLSGARNFGLNHINGDLIMFVDADDWLDLNCLEECISIILKHKDIDCIIFPYIREFKDISKKNNILGVEEKIFKGQIMKDKIHRRLFGPLNKELLHPDAMDNLNTAWSKLYFSKFVKDMKFVGAEKIGTAEDITFNIELFYKFDVVYYLLKVYYHYNKINETSIVHTYKKDLIITRQNFRKYALEFIQKYKLEKEYYKALNNRIVLDLLTLIRNIMGADKSYKEKYNLVKDLLCHSRYKKLFADFEFKYLGLKWKLYYFLCKKEHIIFVMLMTFLAEKLKKYLK